MNKIGPFTTRTELGSPEGRCYVILANLTGLGYIHLSATAGLMTYILCKWAKPAVQGSRRKTDLVVETTTESISQLHTGLRKVRSRFYGRRSQCEVLTVDFHQSPLTWLGIY